MHGRLPCRVVLANRHIRLVLKAPYVWSHGNIKHMAFQCKRVNGVREVLGLENMQQEACNVDRSGSAWNI